MSEMNCRIFFPPNFLYFVQIFFYKLCLSTYCTRKSHSGWSTGSSWLTLSAMTLTCMK